MTRMRRVIEIRQRETSVSIRMSSPNQASGPARSEHATQGIAESVPTAFTVCPVCETSGMLCLADVMECYFPNPETLSLALARGGLHLSQGDGTVWFCEHTVRAFLAEPSRQPRGSP